MRRSTVFYDLMPAYPTLKCCEGWRAGVITKVSTLLRQYHSSHAYSGKMKPIRHSFLKEEFHIRDENANLISVIFLYTLAVKL